MRSKQNDIQEGFINKGVKHFKDKNIGYYDLAMRAGKCRVTIELLKRLFDYDCTILICFPDNKLLTTWQEELVKWNYNNPNITFTNFSSLKKYTNFEFDVLIIDEFHSTSDKEFGYSQEIIKNCSKTICLSGTVSEETNNLWNIPCIAKYSTLEGIEEGILADYTITIHLVDLDTKRTTKNKKGQLKTEKQMYDAYTYVINKMKDDGKPTMHLALARNRLSQNSIAKLEKIRKLLKQLHDKRVIVFTGLSKAADEIGISSYHSKSKSQSGFDDFQSKKVNHLALAAMGKIGVTYNDLDSVILSNFTYNAEESSQILNRAIKLDYHGKVADLHVLCINEKPELKKIKESLSMLDQDKIKYV